MTRGAELTGDQRALAISALVKLVRQEYPADLSLHEIATTWGEGITQEELDALRACVRPVTGEWLDLSPHPTPVWRRAIVEQDDELEPAPTRPAPVYEDTDFA